jgi:division protein CdvB (Snf7/Vps24/ESCRT-III family)
MQAVMAQLQGGRPVEAMFLQAVGLLTQLTEKLNRMDDELKELRRMKG